MMKFIFWCFAALICQCRLPHVKFHHYKIFSAHALIFLHFSSYTSFLRIWPITFGGTNLRSQTCFHLCYCKYYCQFLNSILLALSSWTRMKFSGSLLHFTFSNRLFCNDKWYMYSLCSVLELQYVNENGFKNLLLLYRHIRNIVY